MTNPNAGIRANARAPSDSRPDVPTFQGEPHTEAKTTKWRRQAGHVKCWATIFVFQVRRRFVSIRPSSDERGVKLQKIRSKKKQLQKKAAKKSKKATENQKLCVVAWLT